jgi:hypothetical protein
MRLRALLALAAGAVCLVPAPASAATKPVPISGTFVGDSVSASLTYVPSALATLDRGLALNLNLKVCRRLVVPSCAYDGSAPTTALQAVRSYGRGLGKVLIVDVGYNESTQGYAPGIDKVMRTALAEGVRGVVWVTLRETIGVYRSTNAAIRAAAQRWPQLVVADWNAYSAGKPWFRVDGLHLTASGAHELAAFLRPYVLEASVR